VRLLRRLRIHTRTDAAPLWRCLQRRRCRLVTGGGTSLADKLVKCRQTETPYFKSFTITGTAARNLQDSLRCTRKIARGARKPPVAASRLLSFPSQTRTATVAGRPFGGAHSVSPVPARIALHRGRNARAPMR